MAVFSNAWKTIILLWLVEIGNSFAFFERFWSPAFTANVVRSGFLFTEPAATTLICGNLCASLPACQSFGHNLGSKGCWLYDHMVEFTTIGIAAPGTRYFWRRSKTCPAVLNYTLEGGTCYKIDSNSRTYLQARDFCGRDGGSLLVVNQARLQLIKSKLQGYTWVGGSDVDVEGVWWLSDGTRLYNSSSLWSPGQPDNWEGSQHGLAVSVTSKLDDTQLDAHIHVACQIHLT